MHIRMPFLALLLLLTGCISLAAPYDATFDQSLNKLSEDTATFLAAASAGGSERNFSSQEAVAYYAATYNVLDRLIERARLARGSIPCRTEKGLEEIASGDFVKTVLPEDRAKLDCRESQLYSIRIFIDQLNYAHETNGVLNKIEAAARGRDVQAAIIGTIETFLLNKPET